MNLRSILLGTLLVSSLPLTGWGQLRESSYHVFPQIADGGSNTGLTYVSYIFITRFAGSATCTLTLRGIDSDRLRGDSTQTVSDQLSVAVFTTTGTSPELQTGYATLSCTAPVTAYAAYLQLNALGLNAMAAVFSSSSGRVIEVSGIICDDCPVKWRVAIALANDSFTPVTYQLLNNIGGTISGVTRTIAAHTSEAFFVDELLDLPESEHMIVPRITVSSGELYAVGLQFLGDNFLTIPPMASQ